MSDDGFRPRVGTDDERCVMIVGAVCLSHSPLIDRNRADPDVERGWQAAVAAAGSFAAAQRPDLCIVFYPDHLNGFLYDLLPAFCMGIGARSLGDFGTVPGLLDVPAEIAASCAASCLASGIDIALSYNMPIDHGGAQPIELLAGEGVPTRCIPVFINCAAPPRPTFARSRALGQAIGAWAGDRDERILMIGSGGLSHDPPLPSVANATGESGRRLREGGALSHADRLARQHRVHGEGKLFASGNSALRALNPDWDRRIIEAFAAGDIGMLGTESDEAISAEGGAGAHELRCWTAALAAVAAAGGYTADPLFYAPVEPWITGMGVLTAVPINASAQHRSEFAAS